MPDEVGVALTVRLRVKLGTSETPASAARVVMAGIRREVGQSLSLVLIDGPTVTIDSVDDGA